MPERGFGLGAWDERAALFVDLYELTMAQAYFEEGRTGRAVFSLFARRLPERRNFLVACGLDAVLDFLEGFSFGPDARDYLASLGRFSRDFLERLGEIRFTGDVWAVPEGTPVFANEPILEIEAPVVEAQLVETFVMNQIHVATLAASKAARVVAAAAGRGVIEFGARRMQGTDAALQAARAAYIVGATSTSNLLAGRAYGVPVAGTMAHAYVQAHESELDAFRAFTRTWPATTLLVDTYGTADGVRNVIRLARELGRDFRVRAIRMDSGDLGALAKEARAMLDAAGLEGVKIVASGGLDEDKVAALVAAGAPIDAFGVGTAMGVSEDAPSLDVAYKLVAYEGAGRLKLSPGKRILPGRKQVWRRERAGRAAGDTIALAEEELEGCALLVPAMRGGRRVAPGRVPLEDLRKRAADEIGRLPPEIRALEPADPPYPVEASERLGAEAERIARSVAPD